MPETPWIHSSHRSGLQRSKDDHHTLQLTDPQPTRVLFNHLVPTRKKIQENDRKTPEKISEITFLQETDTSTIRRIQLHRVVYHFENRAFGEKKNIC
jgi:hypothetical protein